MNFSQYRGLKETGRNPLCWNSHEHRLVLALKRCDEVISLPADDILYPIILLLIDSKFKDILDYAENGNEDLRQILKALSSHGDVDFIVHTLRRHYRMFDPAKCLMIRYGTFSLDEIGYPEEIYWDVVTKTNTTDAYNWYINHYPKGQYISAAKTIVKQLQRSKFKQIIRKHKNNFRESIGCLKMFIVETLLIFINSVEHITNTKIFDLRFFRRIYFRCDDSVSGYIKIPSGDIKISEDVSMLRYDNVIETYKDNNVYELVIEERHGLHFFEVCRLPLKIEFVPDNVCEDSLNNFRAIDFACNIISSDKYIHIDGMINSHASFLHHNFMATFDCMWQSNDGLLLKKFIH